MNIKLNIMVALLISATYLFGQDNPPKDWHHLDLEADSFPGMSVHKAYKELLKGKQSKTVIVAVLDSGIDLDHEDLKEVMWVNQDEKAGNKADDDNNGYTDDIMGWNFIGGKNGENVYHENLEVTRIYVQYKEKFNNVDPATLKKKEKKDYELFKKCEKEIKENQEIYLPRVEQSQKAYEVSLAIQKGIGKEAKDITAEDLANFKSEDPTQTGVAKEISELLTEEEGITFKDFILEAKSSAEHRPDQLKYYYNPEYDARHIVGDNYSEPYEKNYGNSDAEGPDAMHGTHVAGIIGAVRNNNIGMDGVADNVRIMSVRTVPDGDERDKDVANAIIYAVDNGASIINMSFGKAYSPYKEAVDKAVKYAMKHDVLIVNSAGNSRKEVLQDNVFPSDHFAKKGLFGPKFAKNYLQVGASSWTADENLAARFSNYSNTYVDVFAPGVRVYSSVPSDGYRPLNGTSMASPAVAGVAALLRSYYPELSAKQVKQIIMDSAVKQKGRYVKPGTKNKVSFSQLCVTGGIVNAYEALVLASKTKGKKKK